MSKANDERAARRAAGIKCSKGHELTGLRDTLSRNVCLVCRAVGREKRTATMRAHGPYVDPKTHCIHGHTMADAYYEKTTGKRKCRTCTNGGRPLSEQKARRMVEAVRAGQTLYNMENRFGDNRFGSYIAKPRAIKNFLAANPKLARIINPLLEKNRVARLVQANQSRRVASRRVYRNADAAMELIARAVPRTVPDAQRKDIVSLMALAYVEGELELADIELRWREFFTKQYRAFSSHGPASLDALAFREGTTTVIETISTTQGMWA